MRSVAKPRFAILELICGSCPRQPMWSLFEALQGRCRPMESRREEPGQTKLGSCVVAKPRPAAGWPHRVLGVGHSAGCCEGSQSMLPLLLESGSPSPQPPEPVQHGRSSCAGLGPELAEVSGVLQPTKRRRFGMHPRRAQKSKQDTYADL